MGLFINEDGALVEAKKTRFPNEKEIQQTVENNLESMLDLTLVDSEFSFGSNRIDTLAFDNTRKIFVIIEYKIDEDKKISNQALGYYGDMIANQSDFLVAYHENVGALSKNTVNWKKTRILLIAPKFDESLLSALHDPDVKFELWKINLYQHGIIEFKQLRSINKRIVEIDSLTSVKTRSLRTGDIASHLEKCNENTRSIYEELERQIRKINSNVELLVKKVYVSFEIHGYAFVRFYTHESKLHVYMRIKSNEMHIPNRSTLVIKKGMRGYVGGDSEIRISKKSDIVHLMKLIKQSYDKTIRQKLEKLPIIQSDSTKYTEAEYLNGQYMKFNISPETRQLWSETRRQILNLGDLEVKQVKTYAKFCPKGENRPICGLGATNSKLNLTYNTKVRDGLLSPSDFVMDISKKGHLGLGHYKSYITTKSDIAKAIPLIKKIYQDRLKF